MMGADRFDADWLRRRALIAAAFLAFAGYVAVATFATLIIPAAFAVFLLPFALIGFVFAPQGKAAPKAIIAPLITAAAALMPLWPLYIHLKFGPAPILTPPRLILYVITAFWIYDMAASPLRRGQFLVALKRSRWLSGLVFGFFALNAVSVPIAEGSLSSAQEFFRQVVIWLLPFCAFVTYVRKFSEFKRLLVVTTLSAGIAGLIAIIELGTGTLLAMKLSPLISDDAAWLRIAQELKSRDGVFRAQATHTHPLSLGEYLGFCAPLAFAFMGAARSKRRILWGLVLVTILAGVAATGARGALLGMAAGLGVTGGLAVFRLLRNDRFFRFRPLIGLATISLFLVSPVVVYGAHKVITGAAGTSAAKSSQARIDQIKMAWPKIIKRPVGGYGTGRATRIIGYWGRTLSVDNYYLTLAVELGFPGPIVFFSIMIVVARTSERRSKRAPPAMRWVLIGLTGAMASFAVSRMILSQAGNLSYFYLLVGGFIGASARFPAIKDTRHADALQPIMDAPAKA